MEDPEEGWAPSHNTAKWSGYYPDRICQDPLFVTKFDRVDYGSKCGYNAPEPTPPALPTVFDFLPEIWPPAGPPPDSVVDYILQDEDRFVVVLSVPKQRHLRQARAIGPSPNTEVLVLVTTVNIVLLLVLI
ncbi:hypothetical protein ACOSQ2_029905 [Xanthoceras sorbifolium]